MTLGQFIKKTKDLPKDAWLMSDSGWECNATDCDRAFYSPSQNIIVLTQTWDKDYDRPFKVRDADGWKWQCFHDWREL